MKTFDNISFIGEFRSYQQRALGNIEKYLSDGKVHIVAAPGSGKTILGLEIIRCLNKPALILSPTITIRDQWGDRFTERFLPSGERFRDYFSFSLREPGLLTSITYQSLHSAYNRLIETGYDEEEDSGEQSADYTDFDLLRAIRKAGVGTVCLDEAHHLKSEWQRSLEGFIAAVKSEVTVVALTATPPYDSMPAEWKRYTDLCGEIDEEIPVPELVKQKTLCPHQDYIYFNYPTKEETEKLKVFRDKAENCVNEFAGDPAFNDLLEQSGLITGFQLQEEFILENAKGSIALLSLAQSRGIEIPKKLVKLVCPGGRLPEYKLVFAETAFQFVLDNTEAFSKEAAEVLRKKLSENGFIDRNRVCLQASDRINRMLISSAGKLDSIAKIAQAESASLSGRLRMLVLTDYIKKDLIRIVGTGEHISVISTVTIFETIRRAVGKDVSVAVLSGGLVILPNNVIDTVKALAGGKELSLSVKPIENTGHGEVVFGGTNRNKVAIITEVFQKGYINVLVGTKALLGEGWDSPCINSLILASFVGSFVLSNQMRGRAIRIDKDDPQKSANIWHLVTIEPPTLKEKIENLLLNMRLRTQTIVSGDYETLVRRFGCFLAPDYQKDVIQSGISRVSIIKPPFNKAGFDAINKKMLDMASRRSELKDRWDNALSGPLHPEVLDVAEAPPSVQPTSFMFTNLLYTMLLNALLIISVRGFMIPAFSSGSLLYIAVSAIIVFLLVRAYRRLLKFISPKRTINTFSRCVLKTLKDMGIVSSEYVCTSIESDPDDVFINCGIINATLHEKAVFASAMRELLTSIDNPRYIIINKYRFLFFTVKRYGHSYACPSVMGSKKENAELFLHYLKRAGGAFEGIYTRSEAGRKELLKCRRKSYINRNEIFIYGKKIVRSKWE